MRSKHFSGIFPDPMNGREVEGKEGKGKEGTGGRNGMEGEDSG